jgi:hypothetical protein
MWRKTEELFLSWRVEIVFVPWYILTLMWLVTRMLVPGLAGAAV